MREIILILITLLLVACTSNGGKGSKDFPVKPESETEPRDNSDTVNEEHPYGDLSLGDAEYGRVYFFAETHGRCLRCHTLNGEGEPGTWPLDDTGLRRDPEWLAEFIDNPRILRPEVATMPPYRLDDTATIADIVAFLMTLRTPVEHPEQTDFAPPGELEHIPEKSDAPDTSEYKSRKFHQDITDPSLNFSPLCIGFYGDYEIVAGYVSGVHIFKLTDDNNFEWINMVETDGEAYYLDVTEDGICYVADGSDGIVVIDLEPIEDAHIIDRYETSADAISVTEINGYISVIVNDWSGDGPHTENIKTGTYGDRSGSETGGGGAGDGDEVDHTPIADSDSFLSQLDFQSYCLLEGYLYVIDTEGNLVIYDSLDPYSGEIASTFVSDKAGGIVVDYQYAYITTQDGFQIFDIDPPEDVSRVGELEVDGFLNQFQVWGELLFGANYVNGLQLFDVSTPEFPVLLTTAYSPGEAFRVDVADGSMCIVNGNDIQVYEIDTSMNASFRGFVETPEDTIDAITHGGYIYSADGASGLHVIRMDKKGRLSITRSVPIPGRSNNVAADRNYLYATDGLGGVHLIDIESPARPEILKTFHTSDWTGYLGIDNGLAAVSMGETYLTVIQTENDTEEKWIETIEVENSPEELDVDQGYVYLTGDWPGLKIYDARDPGQPELVRSLWLPGDTNDVEVAGNYAYVTCFDAGVAVVDISDPRNAYVTEMIPSTIYSYDVSIDNGILYVADYFGGVRYYRIEEQVEEEEEEERVEGE